MIERSTYESGWWGQEVYEIRFRQESDTTTPGDRRAVRYHWNSWDDEFPQHQWSLETYFPFGWASNPFHLRASEEDLLEEVFFTEEEALAFAESGTAPVAIRNILEKRNVE